MYEGKSCTFIIFDRVYFESLNIKVMYHQGTLLIYLLSYTMIFIFTWLSKSNNSNRLFDEKGGPAKNTENLIGLHVGGIILLGLLPLFILNRSFNELLYNPGTTTVVLLLLFASLFLLIIITGFRAGSRIQIKDAGIHVFSNRFLIEYFAVRILFLSSYELFFRGLLLFDCIKWFGNITAIVLTTLLTVLIHLFTNKKEMWACVPFGIILSIFCIAVNAVWPAVLLHIALSMAYEVPVVTNYLTKLKPAK